MKKNIFKFSLVAMVLAMFASCSQNDEMLENLDNVVDDNTKKEYVYTLHIDGDVPGFVNEDGTRAVGYWKKGDVLQLRFKSGSSYVSGSASYNGSVWTVTSESKLSATKATEFEAYYIQNGQYGGTLTPSSTVYYGEGTYITSSVDIYVKIKLSPFVWRMRFKGSSGTKISMPKSENDIEYVTYTGLHSSGTFGYSSEPLDVQLTVGTNGYTEYIHGMFVNINGNNTITVVNEKEGNTYTKEFSASKLTMGESGYLTVPTSSNYASLGWKKIQNETVDPNATAQPNFLCPLYDGMVTDWKFGSTASTFYQAVYRASFIEESTDEDIIASLTDDTAGGVSNYEGKISGFFGDDGWFSENTNYYLCTIAYNAKGERGPLVKREFTTRSSSDPIASISNLSTGTNNGESVWSMSISLKNGATKYYAGFWTDYTSYNKDAHWLVYYLYRDIHDGEIYDKYNFTSAFYPRNTSQIAMVTVAVDKNGNLGGYSVAKYPTSSTARTRTGIVKSVHQNKYTDVKIMQLPKTQAERQTSPLFFLNAN